MNITNILTLQETPYGKTYVPGERWGEAIDVARESDDPLIMIGSLAEFVGTMYGVVNDFDFSVRQSQFRESEQIEPPLSGGENTAFDEGYIRGQAIGHNVGILLRQLNERAEV